MPRPFGPVQYSCVEAATKRLCLKSQPLHSRRFSCTKPQNLSLDKIRRSKLTWFENMAGFEELFTHVLGMGGHDALRTSRHSGARALRTLRVAITSPHACRVVTPSDGDDGYKSPVC